MSSVPLRTTTRGPPTLNYSTTLISGGYSYDYDQDIDAADFEYDYYAAGTSVSTTTATTVPTTTTTTTTVVPCTTECKLELFSKTLLRGKSVELTEDTSDLSDLDFNNKVISLRVTGPCSWSLYKDTNYTGDSVSFVENLTYKNAVDLGKVFRKASSVKKSGGCS